MPLNIQHVRITEELIPHHWDWELLGLFFEAAKEDGGDLMKSGEHTMSEDFTLHLADKSEVVLLKGDVIKAWRGC